MQLGISSYTYPWGVGVAGFPPPAPLTAQPPLTALSLLERAARLGVRVLQVADNLPLDRLAPSELAAFGEQAARRGITIELGTRGIDPPHLLHWLALARRLESPLLRVVVDTPEHQPSPDEAYALLTALRRPFEQAGVLLAIENHDRFPARVLADLVRRLGPWAGVCLDTVNSFGALEGPQVVVETLAPLTVNLHLKDFTIQRASHNLGFTIQGSVAGQGRLEIPWLLGELKRHNYDGSAILEQWPPPEAALADTIVKEERWAAESVAYLRGLIAD